MIKKNDIFLTGWAALGYKSYNDYINSDLWKHRKEAYKIMRSNDFKCDICGIKNNLEVHHKHYENVTNETAKDLMLLCHKCHGVKHGL